MNYPTCHVFSLTNTPSNKKYSISASAQKIRNLCWMLKHTGYRVIYYGYDTCDVECDEKVVIGSEHSLKHVYPDLETKLASPGMRDSDYIDKKWVLSVGYELEKRYKPQDIFFWMQPCFGQRGLYNKTYDWPVKHVEANITYMGAFLPFRVYQSVYIRDYHYGCYHSNERHHSKIGDINQQILKPHYLNTFINHETPGLYDVVIPRYFDVSLFDFKLSKEDYLLYLARVFVDKGIREAVEIAERLEMKLIVAGPGNFENIVGKKPSKYIEVLGSVGPEKRRDLLANAKAVLSLTHRRLSEPNEPFGGAAVEAMLSGTVPIVSDTGGYLDTVKNGYNGYRINYNDIQSGVDAVQKIDEIDPFDLRKTGLYYSRENIALQYDAYIQYICKSSISKCYPPVIRRCWESENTQWPDEWMIPIDIDIDTQNS